MVTNLYFNPYTYDLNFIFYIVKKNHFKPMLFINLINNQTCVCFSKKSFKNHFPYAFLYQANKP